MTIWKKVPCTAIKAIIILGIIIAGTSLFSFRAFAQIPTPRAGITFEQQFPNIHTAQVIASQFGKTASEEISDTDTAITTLDLYGNNLTDIEGIEIFSNLTFLDLGTNNLTSIPNEIDQLSELTYFSLARNNLATVPESISYLTNLKTLELDQNRLTQIPDTIGDLTNLTYIGLGYNQLSSLPNSILNLTNLHNIFLGYNLLPQDYEVTLNQLGNFNFTVLHEVQNQLVVKIPTTEIITTQEDFDNINFASFLSLSNTVRPLATTHSYLLENCLNEDMEVIDLDMYIHNGSIIKSGTVYAQVRAIGTGLFPNTSEHALTEEFIELIFVAEKFNLSFNLNGGEGNTPTMQLIEAGQLATAVSQPSWENYTFIEWNTSQDGSGLVWDFSNTIMPANNVILYAQWNQNINPETSDNNSQTNSNTTLPNTGNSLLEQIFVGLVLIIGCLTALILTKKRKY